jgi:hypothetical protein
VQLAGLNSLYIGDSITSTRRQPIDCPAESSGFRQATDAADQREARLNVTGCERGPIIASQPPAAHEWMHLPTARRVCGMIRELRLALFFVLDFFFDLFFVVFLVEVVVEA